MKEESRDVFVGVIERWFTVRAIPLSENQLILFHTDITEKIQAQRQAELEASRYRELFNTGAPKYVVAEDGLSIRDANQAALDQLGWTREEINGQRFDHLFEPHTGTLTSLLRSSASQESVIFCSFLSPQKKIKIPVEIHSSSISLNGERTYVLVVMDRGLLSQQRLKTELATGDRSRLWPDSILFHQCIAKFRSRHLSQIPYIDELIGPLLHVGRAVKYTRGEFFISAGQASTHCGISSNAYFRAFLVDSKGNEVTVQFFRPGEFIVSYTAMVKKESSELYIQALNDCEVFVMDAVGIYDSMLKDQRWFILQSQILQELLFVRERRELDLLTTTLRKRYDDFVANNQDLMGLLHNYQIASYLGVAPETLSRVRKGTRTS